MDGSGRRVVWSRARSPAGLTFGGASTRLYWADQGECGAAWRAVGLNPACPRGDAFHVPHLKPPVSVSAERGAIGSVELDGSHFRLVREGLHGLRLFAIGDGFLLWSTTTTNGETI